MSKDTERDIIRDMEGDISTDISTDMDKDVVNYMINDIETVNELFTPEALKINAVIKLLMSEKGFTQQKMGELLGEDPKIAQANFRNKLKVENPTLNTIIKILDLLAYKVVVMPKDNTLETGEYHILKGETNLRAKVRKKK